MEVQCHRRERRQFFLSFIHFKQHIFETSVVNSVGFEYNWQGDNSTFRSVYSEDDQSRPIPIET